jgi:hypothetical protein
MELGMPGSSSPVVSSSQAIVPRLMKFSGVLLDTLGKPLSGPVDVTFTLYNTEAGGNPLWFETQSVQADNLGHYTALLGAMHADGLPVDLFTSGEVRWLGIQIGAEAEQQPRVLLVSVPYALKAGDAETLGGKPASAYVLSDAQSGSKSSSSTTSGAGTTKTTGSGKDRVARTTNTTPLTPVCSSVTSNSGGALNSIAMFSATCDVENSIMTRSGNNIGIGTASPTYSLDVTGPSNASVRLSGAGTHQLTIAGATSGRLGEDAAGFFFSSDTSGGAVRFLTNNGTLNEWMRVTSAGNVGIGTTTPAHKIDVFGDVSARTAMIVDNAGLNNGAVTPGITFGTTSGEGIASKRTAGGNQYGLDFYSNFANRMSITKAGLVGIGTTTPQYTLDVTGNIRALTALNVDGLGVNNGSLSSGLSFGAGSGEGVASKRTAGGNQYGLDFYTEYANRMSISQAGRVGIGTSTPYTTLHLRGDVPSGLGPTLLLMNGGAGGNAGASIDWDGYDPGISNLPSARIQSYDDGNFSSHLTFQTKVPGAATDALVEQVRISSHGSLIVDSSAENTGTLSDAASGGTGLEFGGSGSGEGIASCRTGTSCPTVGYSFTTGNVDGLDFFTNFHARMSIANNGDIYLSGCSWWANGNNQGSCPSDARLKTNIQPLPPVLDKLARLRPVHFNYRAAEYPQYHFPSVRMTGLIAQEVEKVFPELVSTDEQGYKALDSGPLRIMLLEGVQELKTRNDTLRRQVGEQQVQLQQARAKIENLSSQVRKLRQDQTEIAVLKARLDRLEAGGPATLRAQAAKGRQSSNTQVARALTPVRGHGR